MSTRRLVYLLWLHLFSLYASSVMPSSSTHEQTTMEAESSANLFNCSFETADLNVKTKILTFIDVGKELIFLHFRLPGFERNEIESNGTIYKILDLVRTKGGQGNELLLMHPQFEILSLGLLMFGVEHVDIHLKELPKQCFINTTEIIFEQKLFEFASNEFNLLEQENNDKKVQLCDTKVKNNDGQANFFFNCCLRNTSGEFVCGEIERNMWLNVLYVVMTVTYVIAFLFTPYLIPASWYRDRVNKCYLIPNNYKVTIIRKEPTSSQNIPKTSTEQATSTLSNLSNFDTIYIPLADSVQQLQQFKKIVANLNGETAVNVEKFKIDIEGLQTITSGHVPAGMFHYLYRQFVNCNIKDHHYVGNCCNEPCCILPNKKCCDWHRFLKPMMQGVFFLLLLCPYFVRVLLFYLVEAKDRNEREEFSRRKNLDYPNIFDWNLTYTLKPGHVFFIICYASAFFLPFCKYFIKCILTNSDDFGKEAKLISERCIQILLTPCTKLGIWGAIVGLPYALLIIPCIICIYMFISIPLIRISISFIVSLIKTNAIKTTKTEETIHGQDEYKSHKFNAQCSLEILKLVAIMFVLAASMILCLEVVVFFLAIFMYVSIGIILNASLVLTYVTFAGMLLFYAYDSVTNVKNKYKVFSKAVIEFLSSIIHTCQPSILQHENTKDDEERTKKYDENMKKCNENTKKNETNMKNDKDNTKNDKEDKKNDAENTNEYAIGFPIDLMNDSITLRATYEFNGSRPTLNTKYPILFFDRGHTFMSEATFLDMCCMRLVGAPGPVWRNYKHAFHNFIVIAIFLTFVTIIVLAFGQSKGVPGTYQAIATLGGGLIPFLLRKYFFKYEEPLDLKTDHVLFNRQMIDVIHEETWAISDIVIGSQDSSMETDRSLDKEFKC